MFGRASRITDQPKEFGNAAIGPTALEEFGNKRRTAYRIALFDLASERLPLYFKI